MGKGVEIETNLCPLLTVGNLLFVPHNNLKMSQSGISKREANAQRD